LRANNKRLNFEDGYCSCCGNDFQKEKPIIGYEVRGLYDGVLHWKCTNCNIYHYRFNKKPMTQKQYDEWVEEKLKKTRMK